MKIKIVHQTLKNKHHNLNQDYYLCCKNQWKQMLFSIADGVGSLSNSQIASKISCETLKKEFLRTNFTEFSNEQIKQWGVDVIQNKIFASLQQFFDKIATTLSFVVISNKQIYVFHVGNTRIFQIKNSNLHQITTDHLQTNLENDTFSWVKHKTMLNNFISNKTGCYVDCTILPLDVEALIFTTDGIHDFVNYRKLKHCFTSKQFKKDIKDRFVNLFQWAHFNGSLDDQTCLYVEFA